MCSRRSRQSSQWTSTLELAVISRRVPRQKPSVDRLRVLESSCTRALPSGRSCPFQLKSRGPGLPIRCALRRLANQRAPQTNAATKRLSWGRLSVPQAMTPQQPASMYVPWYACRLSSQRGIPRVASYRSGSLADHTVRAASRAVSRLA